MVHFVTTDFNQGYVAGQVATCPYKKTSAVQAEAFKILTCGFWFFLWIKGLAFFGSHFPSPLVERGLGKEYFSKALNSKKIEVD
jgi:hypothetical protein